MPWTTDAADVVEASGSDGERGLTSSEAAARLGRLGPNRLTAAPEVSQWRRLVTQFADPLVYLLLVAAVVSTAAWVLDGTDGLPLDAIVIGVIVLANGVLGYAQERQAEKAVAALQKLSSASATVVRDGLQVAVPAEDLVVGDVLVLAEGDAVGADGRLIQSAALSVAEAPLTGESEPVLKDCARLSGAVAVADRTDMVFSGTAVTSGRARAVVTATGMDTEVGAVARLLEGTAPERTPLQRELDGASRSLGIAVLVVAAVVVAAIAATSDLHGAADVVQVLLVGVALAVAAVPEGLQTIVTVVLALGVRRMVGRGAIVKKLSSVETLGSASVICTDKTGTLTRNEMTVRTVITHTGELTVSGAGYEPRGEVTTGATGPLADLQWREARAVLLGGLLSNDASVREEDGAWVVHGDPTEAALVVAGLKLHPRVTPAPRFTRVGEVPFTSERKLMSTVQRDDADGSYLLVTKGAPDVLLTRCTRERVGSEAVPLTVERRAAVVESIDRLGEAGMRTLGVADRTLTGDHADVRDETLERDLVLAGVVGMIDPPRAEAATAVDQAHAAGLRIVMITGDHPRTAMRIAADLSITPGGRPGGTPGGGHPPRTLTGLEIDELGDRELVEAVKDVRVCARVSPEHKLRLVRALQAGGDVVAMTGDGVNDAPALKAADIGVAMGRSGTDVAKEAARLILVHDDFATIIAAVREGRGIFANIRKFLRYLLSSNTGEVLTMLLGVVGAGMLGLDGTTGLVVPLLATQILWVNLLTDTAPALALGVDPVSSDVMQDRPRPPGQRIIDAEMQVGVFFVGLVMAVATLLTIDLQLPGGLVDGTSTVEQARTAGFTVLVLAQLFNCLNSRSERESAFHGMFSNQLLWAAIALSVALQVLVVHASFLNDAFGTAPMTVGGWAFCVGAASCVLWLDELRKLAVRQLRRSR